MSNMLIAKECDKFKVCDKIQFILNQQLLEQQKAELIVAECATCKERQGN